MSLFERPDKAKMCPKFLQILGAFYLLSSIIMATVTLIMIIVMFSAKTRKLARLGQYSSIVQF